MAETVKHTPGPWGYSINYGPDDEANYANVYDGEDRLVGNLKIHHAIAVVKAMNSAAEMLEALRWVRANHASGITSEINARIDTAIAKATGADQ